MCSARSTAATSLGVAPTAFSRPTRRVWSARRPPTSTATQATASSASAHVPVSRAPLTRWSSAVAYAPMSCQERTPGCAAAKAGADAGRPAAAASPARSDGRAPQVRPATQTEAGRGGGVRHPGRGDRDPGDAQPVARDRIVVPRPHLQRAREGAFDDGAPVADPAPAVTSGRSIGPGAVSRPCTAAATRMSRTPQVVDRRRRGTGRPTGHAGRVRERGQAGPCRGRDRVGTRGRGARRSQGRSAAPRTARPRVSVVVVAAIAIAAGTPRCGGGAGRAGPAGPPGCTALSALQPGARAEAAAPPVSVSGRRARRRAS